MKDFERLANSLNEVAKYINWYLDEASDEVAEGGEFSDMVGQGLIDVLLPLYLELRDNWFMEEIAKNTTPTVLT